MMTSAPVHSVAVLSLLTMTGNEVCVAVFAEPVFRRTEEGVQRAVAPHFAALLGKAMPFWYAASLLLTGASWWTSRNVATGASVLLQVVVLLFTLGLLVPINNRIVKALPGPGWLADARRWDALHRVRVVLLVVASALLALPA